jgi:hypothetical protein
METKSVKIGDLEIPTDYWSMDKTDRRELCLTIVDAILTLLDKLVNPEYCRKSLINAIIDSSIETNVNEENYEVCQVLSDIKQIINE